MAEATVEFVGGPCDGRVEAIPRGPNNELPRELTFKTLSNHPVRDDAAPEVRELTYHLRADVGTAAIYDFRTSR